MTSSGQVGQPPRPGKVEAQLERLVAGEARVLARLISAVENGAPDASAILAGLGAHVGHARVIGITGPPGVGKSTVVDALVTEFRRRQLTVGVVAVDPSSPVSGGAILGDRVRMTAHVTDPGVFIRSVSARGQLGGLSAATAGIVDLMDAAGHDVILVETVGAGQSEVAVAELADCKVVVMAPGLGDDVQAIKAGILEIADLLVVNKADLPNAGRSAEQLRAMLRLRVDGGEGVAVLETTATHGTGIDTLAGHALESAKTAARRLAHARSERDLRLLAGAAASHVRNLVMAADAALIEELATTLRSGQSTLDDAARTLVARLVSQHADHPAPTEEPA